jgi:hypothetical protein
MAPRLVSVLGLLGSLALLLGSLLGSASNEDEVSPVPGEVEANAVTRL